MTQHGGPPGWLEESDPAGCGLFCDGMEWKAHPATPDGPYRLPWFVAAQLWAFGKYPAAVADVLVPNVHKTLKTLCMSFIKQGRLGSKLY